MPNRIICFFSNHVSPPIQTTNVKYFLSHYMKLRSQCLIFCLWYHQLSLLSQLGVVSLVNCLPAMSCVNPHSPCFSTLLQLPWAPGAVGVTRTDVKNAVCPSWEDCIAPFWSSMHSRSGVVVTQRALEEAGVGWAFSSHLCTYVTCVSRDPDGRL